MSHGCEIALGSLDLENLSIALFRAWEIVHERAGVAEVPKRVRQRLLTAGHSVIGHSRFPVSPSLDQIAAMEKNPRAMFVVVRHPASVTSPLTPHEFVNRRLWVCLA